MNPDQLSLLIMRHSAAHVLAAAVTELYGDVKLGVGPVVENGFYYDMLLSKPLTEEDLHKVEEKMREIVGRKETFVRKEMKLEEAIAFFQQKGQDFKVELLRDLKEKGTTRISAEELQDVGEKPDTASLYQTGSFVDLCRGPHVEHSGHIGAFKLTKVAGAYWRGNEANAQLQRVYGVAFTTQQELDAYLTMMEEAKKRDHRKIGAELDLFVTSDLVGAGLPLFTPKGTQLRKALEDFVWQIMRPYGYQRVMIPHLAKSDLYKTSGHWDKFADDIFHVSSKKTDVEFVLKPMNCPHHTQIYASRQRSYRDLPIRYSEVTTVYRDENTGQLAGLSRVRSITQDDAHVFCRLDQVKQEATALYAIVSTFYKAFGMPLEVQLSAHDPEHPEKYLGGKEVWEQAEGQLSSLLDELHLSYKKVPGEAAFYGPKIDFLAKDAIGRQWQLATIQLDFNLPERFGLEYVDEQGQKRRPVMLHRAVLGSVERFISVLIEHYAGAFPFWLAPVQVRIASVSSDHVAAARELEKKLDAAGIRAEVDDSDEKVGKKIRASAMQKVPWTIVVGEKEATGGAFKVNVFGQEEDLLIEQRELIDRARKESAYPIE